MTVKSYHKVKGLRKVELIDESQPVPFGNGRAQALTGSRAQGKAYERKIAKLLKAKLGASVFYNRWIKYIDQSGIRFCQPDLWVELPNTLLLLECKLTQTSRADGQMRELYVPVLSRLYPGKKIYCIQVCKNLRIIPPYRISKLSEVLGLDSSVTYTLPCLGEVLNV